MRLSGLRQAIYDEGDWSPQETTEIKARADRMLNRALQQMCTRLPDLFQRDISLWARPDVSSDTSNTLDRLDAVLDGTHAWVLELQDPAASGIVVDGSWAGRQIEYQDADGVWHSNVIREVWLEVKVLYRFSLMRPIENTTGSEYIIWDPQLWLPPDVVEIRGPARMTGDLGDFPIRYEERNAPLVQGWTSLWSLREGYEEGGVPGLCWEGPQLQLEGPTEAPVVELIAQPVTWAGPDPAGTFEYAITYVMGLRDNDTMSQGAHRDALWESAPSPVSSAVSPVWGNSAVRIHLPVPDWMMDFYAALSGAAAYERDQRSGYRVRIYRRRTATSTGSVVPYRAVTDTMGWSLLAEVAGSTATYTDSGAVIADRSRRLKASPRYRSLVVYPRVTDRTEVVVPAVVRPQPLEHDTDSPAIPDEAIEPLIKRAAVLFFRGMDRMDFVRDARAEASQEEGQILKHGSRLSTTSFKRRYSRGR
jgi:hypothetical protein